MEREELLEVRRHLMGIVAAIDRMLARQRSGRCTKAIGAPLYHTASSPPVEVVAINE